MAHPDIALLNAVYPSVPAVILPIDGGGTAQFDDTTDATATASDIASGKTAYVNNALVTGTLTPLITKLSTDTITANVTSTSSTNISILYPGSAAFTKNDVIWVHIRDTAGKRAGYFFGSDVFFINYRKANNSSNNLTESVKIVLSYTTNNAFAEYVGTTGYGICASYITSSGNIRIIGRYDATNSLTINGSYKAEVFAIHMPTGVTLF